MMNQLMSSAKIVVLAVVLSFGLSYALAWTAPTQTPPLGNVSAPINTGSGAQTKMGAITAGSFTTTGVASLWNVAANSVSLSGDIKIGNMGAACVAGTAGTISYNSTTNTMEYCNGLIWKSLASVIYGALSLKTDYLTGSGPIGLAISPDGTSVYVTNTNARSVSMYPRNTTNGTLSVKTDYPAGFGPYGVGVSPDGTSVYVANASGSSVSMYPRNTTNGTLSVRTDYPTGSSTYGVAVSPDGTSVYVTNYSSNTVSMYSRNTTNGTLSVKTDYPTGLNPSGVAVSPDGTSVYVANYNSSLVSMYARTK